MHVSHHEAASPVDLFVLCADALIPTIEVAAGRCSIQSLRNLPTKSPSGFFRSFRAVHWGAIVLIDMNMVHDIIHDLQIIIKNRRDVHVLILNGREISVLPAPCFGRCRVSFLPEENFIAVVVSVLDTSRLAPFLNDLIQVASIGMPADFCNRLERIGSLVSTDKSVEDLAACFNTSTRSLRRAHARAGLSAPHICFNWLRAAACFILISDGVRYRTVAAVLRFPDRTGVRELLRHYGLHPNRMHDPIDINSDALVKSAAVLRC